jgi:hypothetical protein
LGKETWLVEQNFRRARAVPEDGLAYLRRLVDFSVFRGDNGGRTLASAVAMSRV